MILDITCKNLGFILKIAGYIFGIMQWVIPIILILLITIDMAKGMIGGDEKKSKEALNKAAKRFLYAIILFFIPILVKFIFRAIDKANVNGYGTNNSATDWISCFNEYFN